MPGRLRARRAQATLIREEPDYRVEYNTVRPHEALAWNRPADVHAGRADPLIPNFPDPENLPAA